MDDGKSRKARLRLHLDADDVTRCLRASSIKETMHQVKDESEQRVLKRHIDASTSKSICPESGCNKPISRPGLHMESSPLTDWQAGQACHEQQMSRMWCNSWKTLRHEQTHIRLASMTRAESVQNVMQCLKDFTTWTDTEKPGKYNESRKCPECDAMSGRLYDMNRHRETRQVWQEQQLSRMRCKVWKSLRHEQTQISLAIMRGAASVQNVMQCFKESPTWTDTGKPGKYDNSSECLECDAMF